MQKSTFAILKMDCPSEEQLIRMKLEGLKEIQGLEFDIQHRKLMVYHTGNHFGILKRLDSLNFDTTFIDTVVAEGLKPDDPTLQRRLLWSVLAINLFFFVLEILTGFLSNSMGLVADSLDMVADSIVYGLALFAVGSKVHRKNKVASLSGYFQLSLAILGFIEVIRRFIGRETIPAFQTMIIISVLALIGNVTCLYLLQKSKSKEAHMQASMIFTSNDIIVNFGVIVAGILVYLTSSKYPDLIIGIIVFGIVGRGAIRILNLSRTNQ
jgi:Co/Zn/Cd efflux system component